MSVVSGTDGDRCDLKILVSKLVSLLSLSPWAWNMADVGQDGKCYDKWQAYGQSKTANMLFTVSLAEKLGGKGVESFSLYPGRIVTGIGRHLVREEWIKAGRWTSCLVGCKMLMPGAQDGNTRMEALSMTPS